MVGVANEVARRQDRGQQLLALLQLRLHQVVAVKVEQIEDVIHDGNIVARALDAVAARADSGALLHQAERGPALLVERDNLAVENRGARFDVVADGTQLGIGRGQIVLVARDQAQRAAVEEGDRAIAVPLDLVEPLRVVEGPSTSVASMGWMTRGIGALWPIRAAWGIYSFGRRFTARGVFFYALAALPET